MKNLLILIVLVLSSCIPHKELRLRTMRMNVQGEVMALNYKDDIFWVRFYCADPPYKRQPCYKDIYFKLSQESYVTVGMKYPKL